MEILSVTTPPEAEPIDLADAKLFLRVDTDDDDPLISSIVSAARRYCEAATKSTIPITTYTLTLDSWPLSGGYFNRYIRQLVGTYDWLPNHYGAIHLPNPPLISVNQITYLDSSSTLQTVSSSDYTFTVGSPGRVYPTVGNVWPTAAPMFSSVYVSYTAGMTTVPDNILQAMRLLISHYYNHREGVSDVVMTEVPMAVGHLLGISQYGSYS